MGLFFSALFCSAVEKICSHKPEGNTKEKMSSEQCFSHLGPCRFYFSIFTLPRSQHISTDVTVAKSEIKYICTSQEKSRIWHWIAYGLLNLTLKVLWKPILAQHIQVFCGFWPWSKGANKWGFVVNFQWRQLHLHSLTRTQKASHMASYYPIRNQYHLHVVISACRNASAHCFCFQAMAGLKTSRAWCSGLIIGTLLYQWVKHSLHAV